MGNFPFLLEKYLLICHIFPWLYILSYGKDGVFFPCFPGVAKTVNDVVATSGPLWPYLVLFIQAGVLLGENAKESGNW